MYQWQWTPAGDGKEEWQLCDVERSDSASLYLPNIQKSNEGIYRCIISNQAGSQISKSARLSIGESPHIHHNYMYMNYHSCILLSLSTFSCSSPRSQSPKRVKGCSSRTTCHIHCPCHRYRAYELPVVVGTCWVWG